jgi:hypothetical protein
MTPAPYCVVDLASGANASAYQVDYLDAPPRGGFNVDLFKTEVLALRRIEPGTFMMGGQYETTLTKPYYIGIFEMTQKQYALVTGRWPSHYNDDDDRDTHPVENVSYNAIRGSLEGANWPASSAVDSYSFLGKLRERTGLDFDLPTEAQWEYACRAGTTTKYSYGDSVNGDYMWYCENSYWESRKVGTRKANPWGLYDMHGNILEVCLDWFGSSLNGGTDPVGPETGIARIPRGGDYGCKARSCTSSYRENVNKAPSGAHNVDGFRIVCRLPASAVATTYCGSASTALGMTVDIMGADATVMLEDETHTYDGTAHEPMITVAVCGVPIEPGRDYSVAFLDNVDAGTALAIATGLGVYEGCVTNVFSIGKRPLAIVATEKAKTYGATDPALTYTATGLVGNDKMSGALVRDTGENTGAYAIRQGTLTAGDNYAIAYNGANLTIAPKPLSIVADAKSKTYGAADPALTYTATGLVGSDKMTGALVRDTGENAGTYAIRQGTLTAGDNYTVNFVGATFAITKANPPSGGDEPGGGTVPEGAESKFDTAAVYDGLGHVIDTGALTAAFAAAMGGGCTVQYALDANGAADASTWASSPHQFVNAGEHVMWYRVTSLNFFDFLHAAKVTITPRTLTVKATAKSKTYGAADPVLTYTATGLVGSDIIRGALVRDAGENVGVYAIRPGTLSAGDNYTTSFTGANLTIKRKTLTIQAEAKSKTYGETDPSLTYTVTGLVGSDTVTDRKSTRLNSSHERESRMPSSA